jgi:16S rRNA (cytosine1402-N4)-methyltransferase
LPTHEEIITNPRSRSAKLRVIERVEFKKEKNKYKQK